MRGDAAAATVAAAPLQCPNMTTPARNLCCDRAAVEYEAASGCSAETPASTPLQLGEAELRDRAKLVLAGGGNGPVRSGQRVHNSSVTNGLVADVHAAVESIFVCSSAQQAMATSAISKNKAHAYLLAEVIGADFPTAEEAEALGKRLGTHAASILRDSAAVKKSAATAERTAKRKTTAGSGDDDDDGLAAALAVIAADKASRLSRLRATPYKGHRLTPCTGPLKRAREQHLEPAPTPAPFYRAGAVNYGLTGHCVHAGLLSEREPMSTAAAVDGAGHRSALMIEIEHLRHKLAEKEEQASCRVLASACDALYSVLTVLVCDCRCAFCRQRCRIYKV